ncbi:MAG: endonuclease domain-containing protein [Mycolicibacterium sp.]|uniref:endonuclease domain-containing protein n=1 Tax=Mycolicibacterium sp. TaxID=2320850 RepID=UPI003D0ECC9C
MNPIVGTEALAAGIVNRYQLDTRYRAVHRNVYVPKEANLSAVEKARAAWLWSGRRATLVGVSAAALHGALWIDAWLPAELNQRSQHHTPGIVLRNDTLEPDEVGTVRGLPMTTAARTAFDLGRRKGLTLAVTRLDALMRATGVRTTDISVLVARHRGARGLVQLREAITLADPGAESPQETRTRLILTKAGLRPEQTQIDVFDGFGYHVGRIDMGWDTWKVGVEYDGSQHWTDPRQRARDIDRQAELESLGWRIVRVGADMLKDRPNTIVARTRQALQAAGAKV